MKQVLLSMLTGALLIGSSSGAVWASQGDILDVVSRYTSALANGDVEQIKKVLAGRLYSSRKVLIEQNTEYPNSLRDYYSQASFDVQMNQDDSEGYPLGRLVDVEITFTNGKNCTETLVLQESVPGNTEWRIVDVLR